MSLLVDRTLEEYILVRFEQFGVQAKQRKDLTGLGRPENVVEDKTFTTSIPIREEFIIDAVVQHYSALGFRFLSQKSDNLCLHFNGENNAISVCYTCLDNKIELTTYQFDGLRF
jgi:hypothetical protein